MTAIELVNKVKNLPPVSHAALKLVNLLEQPAVSNDEIVQVLKYDNVLTAKLLRACNSPYFGLEESVSSVDQAVLILGHQQILHIVLTLAFGSAMTVPSPNYALEANDLWQHSLIAATAAEIAADEIADLRVDSRVAFTVGLLHDIGKLVLGQTLSADEQADIRDAMERKQISRWDAEKEILGTDHSEVGATLLQNWKLPDEIVEAAAHHHHPVLEPRPRLSAVTHIANCVAHLSDSSPNRDNHSLQIDGLVIETFHISKYKIENIIAAVRESSDRVDQFMAMV